jgi:hypothetical protein
VLNNDGSACGDADFDLLGQVPDGWTAVLPVSAVSLAPGASTETRLTVTSAVDAPDGVYDVIAKATHSVDPGYSGSGSSTYVVAADTGVGDNAPPVATDDVVLLSQVESVRIDILGNDWDPDGDVISVIAWSQGKKGSVSFNDDGTLTYTPGKRFRDKDSFEYEIGDGMHTATATVSISLPNVPRGGGRTKD